MVPLAYPRTDYQDGTRFLWGILAFRGQSMRKLHVKHFFSLTMGSDSLAETGNSLFAKLVSQGVTNIRVKKGLTKVSYSISP
ncbi:hypothetical protein SETIT_5G081300v2 [Setaria italica]|uniref:Uncharacterized protein n=1 Tax=Setaria italica TaxID=4555 RepID=A0A368R2I9_SETIT|nr:hypothetical protein SETIT_5G081300v2 [Setaria italica]